MASISKEFCIKITNFINPHMFYFKMENVCGQVDAEIEGKLMENASEMYKNRKGYQPTKREIVSAYVPEWGKWVRAQVDLILEESFSQQYVLWCLDQG